MSSFNLEQTGHSTEESIRQAGFDPADLLRGINTEPPKTDPPPVSQVPAAPPPSPAPGDTEIPQSRVREIRSGESVQYAVRIPQGVEDLASFVEQEIRSYLRLDGTHPPVSQANPAAIVQSSDDDDAAYIAELAAWIEWKRGGPGQEPTLPLAWRDTLNRIWANADITRLTFESRNGVLFVKGLTPAEYEAVYGLPTAISPGWSIVGSVPNEDEAAGIMGPNPPLYSLPALLPTGGPPMTMVAGAAAGAISRSGLWQWIKTVGVTAAVSYLTQQLTEQGVAPEEARRQAEMAVESARPKRRRRRRMLTCQDREDILFLKNTLGSGELGKSAIAALLAGCRR